MFLGWSTYKSTMNMNMNILKQYVQPKSTTHLKKWYRHFVRVWIILFGRYPLTAIWTYWCFSPISRSVVCGWHLPEAECNHVELKARYCSFCSVYTLRWFSLPHICYPCSVVSSSRTYPMFARDTGMCTISWSRLATLTSCVLFPTSSVHKPTYPMLRETFWPGTV